MIDRAREYDRQGYGTSEFMECISFTKSNIWFTKCTFFVKLCYDLTVRNMPLRLRAEQAAKLFMDSS